MKIIEGYLSRLVQKMWRDAIVYKEEREDGSLRYWIERRGQEPLGLGASYQDARSAVDMLRRQRGGDHGKP